MRLLAAIVAVLTALLVAVGVAGDARSSPAALTLLQFNLCGNACSSGGLDVATALAGTVDARRPYAMTLNEVCENQFTALAEVLGEYRGHFDPTGPKCRNGARYGNAVFVRAGSVEVVGSWELPDVRYEEYRRLLCVDTGAVTVCVTHISVDRDNRAVQIGAVATVLSGLSGPIVLGGDFNTDPSDPSLVPLYAHLHEVDPGIQPTFDRHKFDYIFLSPADWSITAATTSDPVAGRSDHAALWATATPRSFLRTLPGSLPR